MRFIYQGEELRQSSLSAPHYLFREPHGTRYHEPKRAFQKALKACSIKDFRCHGLRHSPGVEFALAGASDAEIMSQLEHSTPRTAQEYRRQADRARMADAAQTNVDTVISLRKERSLRKAANNE